MVYYPTSVEWKIQWNIVPETCFSAHSYCPRNIFASQIHYKFCLQCMSSLSIRNELKHRTLFNSQPLVIHSATMALYEISSVDSLIFNEFLKTRGFLTTQRPLVDIFVNMFFRANISIFYRFQPGNILTNVVRSMGYNISVFECIGVWTVLIILKSACRH